MRPRGIAYAAFLCCAISSYGQFLILGAPSSASWNTDLQSTLTSTGLLTGGVDVINASSTVPDLSTLLGYKAVLVFSDAGFANSTALGDNLAAYVDAGHGVVVATFENTNTGNFYLGGRWASGGYEPFSISSQTQGTDLHLGTILVPGSPIMAGVTTFDGGSSSYRSTGGVAANTTIIADWSNGDPLVVQKYGFNSNIIGLNFYPIPSTSRSDFWLVSTDGGKLIANSLNLAAVPEPSTFVLMGIGFLLFVVTRRSRDK